MNKLKEEGNRVIKKSNGLLYLVMLLIGGSILISPSYAIPGNIFGKKDKKKDAFSKKDKKRKPNIVCSKRPRTKSRSKQYMHAMSRKNVKLPTKQSVFSATKRRYNVVDNKSKKKSAK